MRLAVIAHLVGGILRIYAAAIAAPLLVAVLYREWHDARGFAVSGLVTLALGVTARRAAPDIPRDFHRAEGLAVVSFAYLAVALLSAIPFVWAGMGPIDAVFEAMSGVTATGASALADFERHGRSFFFWRSLTQWIGGLGVIALFVAVLPRLAIAGRELFFAEAPGPTDEKITPHLRQTAVALWKLYLGLSLAEVAALLAVGMGPFDAISHTFTTIGAGGFSPHPASMLGYASPGVEWVITVFMFLAGANFALQYRTLLGQRRALVGDEEFRYYSGLIVVVTAVVAFSLWRSHVPAAEAVRHAAFQVVSVLTSTGFASVDYDRWPDAARMLLLALMFIGGCAGSAGGGPKVVRHLLVARYTILELARTLHPRAVLPVKLGGRVVPDAIMRAVLVFMIFYLSVFAVCATVVALLGADLVTAISATAATLGNVGPGLGDVGPMSNFSHLHPLSRLTLTLAMWIGRLELITVLALFQPEIWKSARWRDS